MSDSGKDSEFAATPAPVAESLHSNGAVQRYRIGDYEIEPALRRLRHGDGTPVHLARRPYQVLLYLVAHRERIVTRSELREEFWDGRDVYDDSLTRCLSSVRKALRDQDDPPRYIETRWAEGYRYIGPCEEQLAGEPRALEASPNGSLIDGAQRATPPAPTTAPEATAEVAPRRRLFPLYGSLILAAMAVVLALSLFRGFSSGNVPQRSVAVMPLDNLSGSAENEYFSDGLTDTLISTLSTLERVRIISRSSVLSLEGQQVTPEDIGRRLNVAFILEGGVRKDGDSARVSLRLVRASDGEIVWVNGEQNFPITHLFEIQDTIARDVADHLRARFGIRGSPVRSASTTRSDEAHAAYLKGRALWNRRDSESLRQAITSFERAIQADPNYARAYAGLADSYVVAPYYGIARAHDAFPRARAAAHEALRRDETLAEAHATLAVVKEQYDYDWPGAEAEFRRALALNPNYATGHQWYAEFLSYSGRFAEAIEESRLALELDPLSPIIMTLAGSPYLWKRDYVAAREHYERALEQHPNYPLAVFALGRAYHGLRQYDRAIEAYRKAWPASGENTVAPALIQAFSLSGKEPEARRLYEEFTTSGDAAFRTAYKLAVAHAVIGERERALDQLERAFEEREDRLVLLGVNSDFDDLRGEPRFQALLQKVGLTETGPAPR